MAKKAAAKKAAGKGMPFQAVRSDVEVEAGIFAMPFTIAEKGAEPYHPEMLIWMVVDGPVLGQELDRPGALLERAGPLLRAALREMPFLPGILRVESPELAARLRPQISSRVELVCAPTPALGQVLELMHDSMAPRSSYLEGGADPEEVGRFCRAAARMLRARPWTAIAKDLVVGVTIEALGLYQNALALYAPTRGSRGGWILAEDIDELEFFGEQVERRDSGKKAEFPPLKTLVFESRQEMSVRLQEEVRSHGWDIGESWPWIATTTPEGGLATPQAEEFAVGTAICEVLAEAMKDAGALRKAMAGKGPPVVVATRVKLFGEEEVEVLLDAPYDLRVFKSPPNPGLGGQLLAAGEQAGFDVTTAEGLQSWLAELKEKGLPPELQKAFSFFEGAEGAEFPMLVERQPPGSDRGEE